MSVLRNEKEDAEQKFMQKLEELNAIIKKYQNKIFEQENAYKELCDQSTQKLKEAYDNFKNEIQELEKKLEGLINEEKYDECEITNNKIEELKAKLGKLES